MSDWDRERWPLPDFARFSELSGRSYRVMYGGDLNAQPAEKNSLIEDVVGLPAAGVAGARFVEEKLSDWLL